MNSPLSESERIIKLEELARHLRYCMSCGDGDVAWCPDGRVLWNEAMPESEVIEDE